MAEPEVFRPYDPSAFEPGPAVRQKKDIPDGLWVRCPHCEGTLYRKSIAENQEVCPDCDYHFRLGGRKRIAQLVDADSFEELFADIAPTDPLEFSWLGQRYGDRLKKEQAKTKSTEAVLTGVAYIRGRRVALGVMDGDFLMGSMGSVVGEKICLIVEEATRQGLPFLMVSMSGGARMHEGALSVMQMAKTSSALARYDQAGGLYIALLVDPTTGGVTASFAMLGDVIVSEPGAMIAFAGPRVIANTIRAELPEGFQRAEFLMEKGFVDLVIHRHELRSELVKIIDYCKP
ncbi:MAG: acetyl-CoA carboxylase, carboxyltransferase subunit beta [Phycisphaerae bacterium]|nr:acetyl-CoA carboxylase, carboxyltransferase subunit beta [Phycisphaerae bacterium]